MMNKTEIAVYIHRLRERLLKAHPDKKIRRELKDKLVYRLMFDKMRSDDMGETNPFMILEEDEKA